MYKVVFQAECQHCGFLATFAAQTVKDWLQEDYHAGDTPEAAE